MMMHLGDVPAGSTLYIPFGSYNAAGASVTLTGLAVTDIEIYKNGSVTQRASDAGYTLLDTDGINFDGITGINGFSINLADNTDVGFFAVGSFYWVVVSSVTIGGQTVNFIAATFRIVPAETIAGYPLVDAAAISGDDAAANNAESFFDGTGYAGTNNVIPLVTTTTNVTTVSAGGLTAASVATGAIDADALAADAVDEIWAKAMTELSAAPAVNASVLAALSWIFELARNKITETATTQTIYKDDGSTVLSTSTLSDDSVTFTRGEFS